MADVDSDDLDGQDESYLAEDSEQEEEQVRQAIEVCLLDYCTRQSMTLR